MTPLIAQRALIIAAGELAAGVHETPAGSNRGPQIDEYLRSRGADVGQRWCAAFVAWCITEAGKQLTAPAPLNGWGPLVSAQEWADVARAKGRWRSEPWPGMVGVILEEDRHHVVLVKDASPECDWLISVDGNWEDKVAEVERHVNRFAGFVDWFSPESKEPECDS